MWDVSRESQWNYLRTSWKAYKSQKQIVKGGSESSVKAAGERGVKASGERGVEGGGEDGSGKNGGEGGAEKVLIWRGWWCW